MAIGQNENVVLLLRADEFNKNVLLNWSISQGNTCNGIDVFRSIDGVNYTKIGDIEGICGSASEEIDYSFTDLFPVQNSFNFYRLGLGGLGFSYNVKIEIIEIAVNSYQIRPNPVSMDAVLLFKNDASKPAKLKVFNSFGETVSEMVTNESEFNIGEFTELPGGVYRFILDVNEREIKGEIVIP